MPPRVATARAAFDFGSLFGGDKVGVPNDVAAVVAGLKSSTEAALNQGISRLDIELPPAYHLGVEGKDKRARLLEDKMEVDNQEAVARSDRELARVFVEMLQPVGGTGLCVAFRTKSLMQAANKAWKLQPSEGTLISFPEKAKSAFAAEVGVPTQFKQTLEQCGCMCLLVVAPYTEQLRLVHEISKDVQDEMGIVLLNARIHGKGRETTKMPSRLKTALQEEFVPSYHVRFWKERKNGILFSMTTADGEAPWIVAKQRELIGGSVVTDEVLRTNEEPGPEEVQAAFEAFDAKERSMGDKLLDFVDKDKVR